MGFLDSVTKFIPGFKTLEGLGKGAVKLLSGDLKGAFNAVGKGLSNDWLLGLIPPMTAVSLGAIGLDLVGAFGKDEEGKGRQGDATQYAAGQSGGGGGGGQPLPQGPNIGW